MSGQAGRWAVRLFLLTLVGLSAWTAYANVFSDDTALRARAEKLARAKAGCGDGCRLGRIEGTRGVLKATLSYTFQGVGLVTVTCRRPYVAFGDHGCDASKP